jgi:hypothetical protein
VFDSLDSLLITVPVILRYREAFREERNKQILLAINSIRTTKEAGEYAIVFSDLLISLFNGNQFKQSLLETADKIGFENIDKYNKN